MVPRLVLRMKRAVRRYTRRPEEFAPTGPETAESWKAMLARLDSMETETERRLRAVERELNRLGL